jgi:CubicO group peptidase (beta-lactamase class C family)
MLAHRVPGISISLIADGITGWIGYGVLEAGHPASVNAETLFQAASISKPVTVAALLRLVDDGRLCLDDPINDHLRRWQIPESADVRRRLTVRDIASHHGGLSVSHFEGYAPGQPLPTVFDILEGRPPANNPPVRQEAPLGTYRYSSGGITILQVLLSEFLGGQFEEVIEELVLRPLGMTGSTFVQPLPADLTNNAAKGHDEAGAPVPGGWRIYPATAAGGLWSTPLDLARFVIAIQESYAEAPNSFLRPETVREMLRPHMGSKLGLGFHLDDNARFFSHAGINYGYRAHLVASVEGSQAAVIMTNGARGNLLIDEILEGDCLSLSLGRPHCPLGLDLPPKEHPA